MSEYTVLVSCPLIRDSIGEYDDRFERYGIGCEVADSSQQLDEGELLEVIDRYDGVIAGDDEFTARVIESAARLKVISKWGIGLDGIDLEAAETHGVEVYNTPGAFADEVADVVLGYAVMLTRGLHHVDRRVREGEWYCPRGESLHSKTFGVIGVGSIGSTVARRAAAYGMDVIGHDVEPLPAELVSETGIESVGKAELLKRADIVSLNCALTPETAGLIGSEELKLLGPDGYLINTARGMLVDQSALTDALRNGTIAGAGLDVFETEPLPQSHPLTDLENVILGTHNAQNTHEAVSEVNDRAVENLLAGLSVGE